MSGWVYGAGGGSTSPGGSDGDIQFNNNGSFSGSNLLTTDGSGNLTFQHTAKVGPTVFSVQSISGPGAINTMI